MEITLIAIALLTAAGLIYGGLKLNAYSEEKYNYEPINFLTILAMIVPYILLFIGFLYLNDPTNKDLSIIFTLASIIAVFMHILKKTDAEVAIGATVVLLFAGVMLLMLASSTRRDHYYYDD